jgi:cell division transport system permease protein
MAALQYALDEAVKSLWRGRSSGLLSTATIALALVVFGSFLVVTANLDRLSAEWGSAAEMSVYLKDDVTDQQRGAIEAALSNDVVARRDYVSKAEALRRFKQTFGDLSAAVDGFDENPIPASYEVRLRSDDATGAGVESLGARLRETPGVGDVRYDRQWLTRLALATRFIRTIGFILGAVLTIAAALTVANVVRLALFARSDEIEIMELVGAPPAYIRGPFVMEGVLQGGAGAIAALVVLAVGFAILRARYLVPMANSVSLSSIQFLSPAMSVGLVIGGMAVGCLGGLVATWTRR